MALKYLKLGVVVAIVAVAAGSLAWGYPASEVVLNAISPDDAGASLDGVSGPVAMAWSVLRMAIYAAIIAAAFSVAAVVLASTNLLAWAGEGLAMRVGGIAAMIYRQFPQSSPGEMVVANSQEGPVHLTTVLADLSERMELVEAKTSAMKAPPPPKTQEQELRELRAKVAKLESQPKAGKGVVLNV